MSVDYKKLYEQEKARKEWLLFYDMTEFPDGSSCLIRTHLKRDDNGAYLACIGTSTLPSGKLTIGTLAKADTADEAIDKAIEIMKKTKQ